MKSRTLVTAVLALGLLGAHAHAEPATPAARPLADSTLKSLPFNASVGQAMAWVRTRLARHAYPGLDKPAARARAAHDAVRIAKQQVLFDGLEPTGYETSVVDEEFRVGNDETLVTFTDGVARHYLFFFKGRLYKYARPIAVVDATFLDRVAVLAATLGEPIGTYSPDGTTESVAAARWLRKDVLTRIIDRRARYQTDLLVIEDARLVSAVEASRAGITRRDWRGDVSPELDAFLEDAPVQ